MDLQFSRFEIVTGTGALFLGLLFVCLFVKAGDFQAGVGAAAAEALAAEPLYWHAVEPQGRHLLLSGAAADEAARQRAAERAATARGVAGITNEIRVVGAAGACQHRVDAVLRASPLLFRPGQAELLDSSHAVVDALAGALNGCAAHFEIASHTDDRGSAAVNLTLSQRRADLVMRRLVFAGVSADRLRAVGYGETQPLAGNASDSGRAANRRLELRVTGAGA